MRKTNEHQTVQKALLTSASAPKPGQRQPATDQAAHPAPAEKTALIAKAAIALVKTATRLAEARNYSPNIYANIHDLQVRYGRELKALEINVDGKEMNAYSALMQAKAAYAATLEPPGGCGSARSRMNSIPPMASPDLSSAGGRSGKAENETTRMPICDLESAVESLITKASKVSVYDHDLAAHLVSICASEKDRLPSISVKVDGQTLSADKALVLCQKKLESLPAPQYPW